MKRRNLFALPLGLSALAACASVNTEQTTTLVGVVETVDPTSREVLIRGSAGAQSGRLLTMIAGRAVQRLNQVRPGDRVTVTYYQAIAAQAVRPLSSAATPFAGMSIAREADRPGGEVTRVRSGRMTITAVDAATSTVSFTGPAGLNRTVTATNPQVQAFIGQLRVGEQVDMVYEEALAISIEPMR
ncbi:hypothetical protein [Sediminicoccus sp. KRV36]|uniref:hypothetical protein n=1 Tax=Sediminicoccus sp. KRV36 TaxID=3133721 RepID=UPI00200DC23C|nr:hypothetical protein [Sediminicoccus rosea]UPY38428.1 hypothetical protein LHU95_06965 [Sediminicoccus rosea]